VQQKQTLRKIFLCGNEACSVEGGNDDAKDTGQSIKGVPWHSDDDKAPDCVVYTLSVTNKPTEPKLPQTGDNYNPWMWCGIGLGAMALGIAALFWKKKEDDAKAEL